MIALFLIWLAACWIWEKLSQSYARHHPYSWYARQRERRLYWQSRKPPQAYNVGVGQSSSQLNPAYIQYLMDRHLPVPPQRDDYDGFLS